MRPHETAVADNWSAAAMVIGRNRLPSISASASSNGQKGPNASRFRRASQRIVRSRLVIDRAVVDATMGILSSKFHEIRSTDKPLDDTVG